MCLGRPWLTLLLCISTAGAGCAPPEKGLPSAPTENPAVERRVLPAHGVAPRTRPPDPSDAFFAKDAVAALEIEIAPAELEKLRENSRAYVCARLKELGTTTWWNDVAIKLKGAAGSFREFDDKPALTLNMKKFTKKQDFHGLEKFHLNNSVQDETYVHELLCSELFQSADVAAPRVAHARLKLNGRDVGLYVLKEGFDKKFLARHFEANGGNLYDGGFCEDIDAELERDEGKGSDDHADLHALRDACHEPDPDRRWKLLDERLDVDAFLTFAALELMTGHWDGYCLNHNNYRLYFDPTSHKAYFFPHGMDQMFGDPGASILERPSALVAATVMQNPEWRSRYRNRLRQLLPLFSPPDAMLKRVDEIARQLRPVLEAIEPQAALDHAERVRELKERLTARAASLKDQCEQPDPPPPQPLAFDGEVGVELADWEPVAETEDSEVEDVELPGGGRGYRVRCGPGGECIASWRRRVLLARGEYRLVMSARTGDLVPIVDEKGSGAGLRISGATRGAGLEGTGDWKPLEYVFRVDDEEREVVLVAELRANAGEVCFDARSARLFRLSAD